MTSKPTELISTVSIIILQALAWFQPSKLAYFDSAMSWGHFLLPSFLVPVNFLVPFFLCLFL
jgi:hypothetical protein